MLQLLISLSFACLDFTYPNRPDPTGPAPQPQHLWEVFSTLDYVWPAPGEITAGYGLQKHFGPRNVCLYADPSYEFHRGIDLQMSDGTPLVAPLDGLFHSYQVTASGTPYIYLKHELCEPFLWRGAEISKFYTKWMHLECDATLLNQTAFGTPISKNESLFGCTSSYYHCCGGNTTVEGIHLELRLQTTCTLQSQKDLGPIKYNCTDYDLDPHVNPYYILPRYEEPVQLEWKTPLTAENSGVVRVSMNLSAPYLNRIELYSHNCEGNMMREHVLDFNHRIGYDARTRVQLNTMDTTRMYIQPPKRYRDGNYWYTDIILPVVHYNQYRSYSVKVFDIWNNNFTITDNLESSVPCEMETPPVMEGWTCENFGEDCAYSMELTELESSVLVTLTADEQCTLTGLFWNFKSGPCSEETAWVGNTRGAGKAWWYYFDRSEHLTQNIFAGQRKTVGSVTINVNTLSIDLGPELSLQDVDEAIKWKCLPIIPSKRPATGSFNKPTELTFEVPNFKDCPSIALHLDVNYCPDAFAGSDLNDELGTGEEVVVGRHLLERRRRRRKYRTQGGCRATQYDGEDSHPQCLDGTSVMTSCGDAKLLCDSCEFLYGVELEGDNDVSVLIQSSLYDDVIPIIGEIGVSAVKGNNPSTIVCNSGSLRLAVHMIVTLLLAVIASNDLL